METVIENPRLEHISQDIFELLDKKNSLDCRLVNSSWKGIVEKPKFWLKKWSSETGLDSKRYIYPSCKISILHRASKKIPLSEQ